MERVKKTKPKKSKIPKPKRIVGDEKESKNEIPDENRIPAQILESIFEEVVKIVDEEKVTADADAERVVNSSEAEIPPVRMYDEEYELDEYFDCEHETDEPIEFETKSSESSMWETIATLSVTSSEEDTAHSLIETKKNSSADVAVAIATIREINENLNAIEEAIKSLPSVPTDAPDAEPEEETEVCQNDATTDEPDSKTDPIAIDAQEIATPPLYTQVTIMERKKEYAPLAISWEELTRFINSDEMYISPSSIRKPVTAPAQAQFVVNRKTKPFQGGSKDDFDIPTPPLGLKSSCVEVVESCTDICSTDLALNEEMKWTKYSSKFKTPQRVNFSPLRSAVEPLDFDTTRALMKKSKTDDKEWRFMRIRRKPQFIRSTTSDSSSSSSSRDTYEEEEMDVGYPSSLPYVRPRIPMNSPGCHNLTADDDQVSRSKSKSENGKKGVVSRIVRKVSGWFSRKKDKEDSEDLSVTDSDMQFPEATATEIRRLRRENALRYKQSSVRRYHDEWQ